MVINMVAPAPIFEPAGFFRARADVPSVSGRVQRTEEAVKKKKKLSANKPLCHYSDKKKRAELRASTAAYSPRCVKHRLICHSRLHSLTREKRSNKKVLGILSFIDWSRSARSEHFYPHTATNTEITA